MPDTGLYVSTAPFFRAGEPIPVAAGAVAREGHPIIKEAPHLWRPITVDFDVEQPKAKVEDRPSSSSKRASSG